MSGRWSYKVLEIKLGLLGFKAAAVEESLNQAGLQGWELVSVSQAGLTVWAYLKKEGR